MSTQSLPFLDFLVSSVQFSVNNKSIINHPINHGFPVDAIRDYQSSNRLWNFSRCYPQNQTMQNVSQMTDLRFKLIFSSPQRSTSSNRASLTFALLGRFRIRAVAESAAPFQACFFGSSVILRKEVIQPHLPIRLPCYDFTPVTFPTLDGFAGFGCE